MGTKLYVANLPHAPSAGALRAHFSACGVVADVQIVSDRNGGRGRGSALVQMSSAAGAQRALSELNGSTFAGQLLLVEAAPDGDSARHGRGARREEHADGDRPYARITVQYREPANMAYELDCGGMPIAVRLFFPNTKGEWRIVVQAGREADAPSVAAVAASRIEAFRSVVGACGDSVLFAKLGRPDWDAVEKAMLEVRAL